MSESENQKSLKDWSLDCNSAVIAGVLVLKKLSYVQVRGCTFVIIMHLSWTSFDASLCKLITLSLFLSVG